MLSVTIAGLTTLMALSLTESAVEDEPFVADTVSAFKMCITEAGETLVTLAWAAVVGAGGAGLVTRALWVAGAEVVTATATGVVTLVTGIWAGGEVLVPVTSTDRWRGNIKSASIAVKHEPGDTS
jgi:hypothetical protein